jgi:hypothetical protein
MRPTELNKAEGTNMFHAFALKELYKQLLLLRKDGANKSRNHLGPHNFPQHFAFEC